jgi:phage-related minor tail protein
MNEEQMKALLDAMFANVKVELSAVQASVEEKVNTVVAEVNKANGEIATLAIAFAEVKASVAPVVPVVEPVVVVAAAVVAPIIPVPVVLAAGQTVVGNADLSVPADSFEAKLEAINASKMAPFERLKAVTKLRLEREAVAK